MLTINSKDIEIAQNTEENIKIQCAAGYYFNQAEKLNYICWIICGISAVVSFANNNIWSMITMIVLDVCCFVAVELTKRSTKIAADLRKLFDAHVLFDEEAGFEQTEIRELNEKALQMIGRHRKNYEIISRTDGKATPPGKKDWYLFPVEKEPLYAQLECQAQNRWWNKKMVTIRQRVLLIASAIVAVGGYFLGVKFALSTAGIINAIGLVLVRVLERLIKHKKYYNVSVKIDALYETAAKNISIDTIKALQKYIDARRHLDVFEMNIIHRLFAKKLTTMYSEISRV